MYSDPQSRNPQPKVQRDRAPKAELGEVQKVAAPAMSTRLKLRTSNLGLGFGGVYSRSQKVGTAATTTTDYDYYSYADDAARVI